MKQNLHLPPAIQIEVGSIIKSCLQFAFKKIVGRKQCYEKKKKKNSTAQKTFYQCLILSAHVLDALLLIVVALF